MYAQKFGTKDIQIPIDQTDMMDRAHRELPGCMRTREKPHLDVETGAKAVVVINLAAQTYREGKVMYWDDKHWKAFRQAGKGIRRKQLATDEHR